MQYEHAWRQMKGGGNRVVIVADPDAVQVAEICRQDRISIRAIALIAPALPVAPASRCILGLTKVDFRQERGCDADVFVHKDYVC
ncbi:MAG: hypothetical protein A2X45_23080 [Lentisphaerae bacterium GWF2_50_93]|nr:MAG: hypothetical protein A2X45_23080 [Lentisphaerae bacterium GWF2_50_93]